MFIGLMIKRVVYAMLVPESVDDRDYYGNKRLELAGSSLALLFEDLFKLMSQELRKQVGCAPAPAAAAPPGCDW